MKIGENKQTKSKNQIIPPNLSAVVLFLIYPFLIIMGVWVGVKEYSGDILSAIIGQTSFVNFAVLVLALTNIRAKRFFWLSVLILVISVFLSGYMIFLMWTLPRALF